MNSKRRAVSPVIATVILIAVAVALGIAVAFWASGLTGSFSKYEKLGMNTQYAVTNSSGSCPNIVSAGVCWTINLGGQNTGSSDSTITQIQVNGVPYNPSTNYPVYVSAPTPATLSSGSINIPVKSGQSFSISFNLPSNATTPPVSSKTFADGQTIQVVIITAAGNNYPASIDLP